MRLPEHIKQHAQLGLSDANLHGLSNSANTIAVLGDSFVVRASPVFVTPQYYTNATSIWWWMNTLMGAPFWFSNFDGVNGTYSTSFLTRVASGVLAYKSKYAWVLASVNETAPIVAGTLTLAKSIANYSSLFQQCNAAGIKVITNTIPPTTALTTTTHVKVWNKLNAWLMDTAPQLFDLIVVPWHYAYLDPTLLTAQPVASYLQDGTHPNTSGAYALGKIAADTLKNIISPGFAGLYAGLGLAGDDTAIHPNPLNVGTGSAGGNPGVSGSISTSMNVRCSNAADTAVCSKVARTDGPGAWQQVVYTPGAANSYMDYYADGAAKAIGSNQVGDIVSLLTEYEIDGTSAGFRHVANQVYFNGSSGGINANGMVINTTFNNAVTPSGNIRGVLVSPPYAIPAGTTGFYIEASLLSAGIGVATTIRFGNSSLRNYTRNAQ